MEALLSPRDDDAALEGIGALQVEGAQAVADPAPQVDGARNLSTIAPIFILSLPRAGSTLLQRLVAAHSAVSTTAEPFILLPLMYSLCPQGVRSEYGHQLAVDAIREFCAELPAGESDYIGSLRRAALELYGKAASESAAYFVDKTPAYSLMPDTLLRWFPDAKFIFLWRNPLAVVASISTTWYGGEWNLRAHSDYLAEGLPRLVEAFVSSPGRGIAIRYEDLVVSPEDTLTRVFDYLDLPFEPEVTSAFADVELRGNRKDPTGIKRYQSISSQPLAQWAEAFKTPLRRQWARRYLQWLGGERLEIMGYDGRALLDELDAAPTDRSQIARDARSMLIQLALVNARARLLRQPSGFRWV